MTWKDITTYGKYDTNRIPQTFELRTWKIQIVVTRHIHYDPDQWILRCRVLDRDCITLKSKDLDQAKEEALNFVRKELKEIIESIEPINP